LGFDLDATQALTGFLRAIVLGEYVLDGQVHGESKSYVPKNVLDRVRLFLEQLDEIEVADSPRVAP